MLVRSPVFKLVARHQGCRLKEIRSAAELSSTSLTHPHFKGWTGAETIGGARASLSRTRWRIMIVKNSRLWGRATRGDRKGGRRVYGKENNKRRKESSRCRETSSRQRRDECWRGSSREKRRLEEVGVKIRLRSWDGWKKQDFPRMEELHQQAYQRK